MPGTLFDTDTSFPRFTGEETDSEKIQKLQDYLYQLAENFRYLMSNLGIENFNAAELEELGATIRKPVLVAVEKTGERITNIETNIGRDIKGIKTQVTEIDKDVETNKTTIEQTSKMIALVVKSTTIDGETKFFIAPESILLEVKEGNDKGSFTITSDGTTIASGAINLEGFVTFSSDNNGQTHIDGSHIMTGTIEAGTIIGGTIYGNLKAKSGNGYGQGTISGANIESTHVKNQSGRTGKVVFYTKATPNTSDLIRDLVASIYYDDTGEGSPDQTKDRLFIQTFNGSALKMISDAGMSFEGKKIFVVAEGSADGTDSEIDMKAPKVDITGDDINLTGNVYVNGKLIS